MKTLALVFAAAVAVQLAPAMAQYPAVGDAITQLPSDAVAIDYRGSRFYFGAGTWYQQVVAGFVVVTPPAGIVVAQLPAPHTVLSLAGTPVFRANDVYYAASPGGYRVVPAPQASWYYCNSLRSYYPVVSQCAEGWSVFSATPPQLR